MNTPPETVRAHARAYDHELALRKARADEILGGEFPYFDDLVNGQPPLGGSLARDIRAWATLWIPHLRGSHNTVAVKLLPLVEALERIPASQTLKPVWKIAGPLPTNHAVFQTGVKIRLSWYMALMRDTDAIAHIAAMVDAASPFFRHAYVVGLLNGDHYVDPKDAPSGFQDAILSTGYAVLEATEIMVGRYLPFASGKVSVEGVLALDRTPEEQAEDEACEAEAVDICRTLRSPALVEELVVPMHQVLHPVEGHKTSEKRDIGKMYESLTRPIHLHKWGYQSFRNLKRDWPHAADIIDAIAADLRFNQPVKFRSVIFVGASGTGKTSLALAIAEALGLRSIVYPCASSSDNSFGGTPSRWSTASASTPLELIRQSGVANPIVILDELEKGGHHHSGNLEHALLPFLEPHTASRYHETALDMSADLSTVNYIATCNSLEIPAPLRDRFRIMRVPDPGPQHVGALVRRIVLDIAIANNAEEMIPPLAQDEIDVVTEVWKGGSLRKLKRAVEISLETRDRLEVRQ